MILALIWVACAEVVPCTADEPCPFGGTCDAGVCVFRTCTTSDQCPLEHVCDLDGTCVPGCANDDDCEAGDACAQGSCRPTPCVDTHVDCGFREYCIAGTCIDAGEPYCQACTTDDECGPGNLCWEGGYCGVSCDTELSCPAAFECLPVDVEDVTYEVCLAACWLEGV